MALFPVRFVEREGRRVFEMKCPKCGRWNEISKDQLSGWVPVECPEERCDWTGWYNGRKVSGRD